MPVLVCRDKNKENRKYRLEFDKIFTIGRSSENDLVMDNPLVSDRHAEIENEKDFFVLTDQFSRTGTFINNQIVISRRLAHKDAITIGRQRMLFIYEKGEKQPSTSEDFSTRATIAIDTRQHRNKLMKNVLRIANKDRNDRKTRGVIIFTDEKRLPYIMEKDEITLGRSRRCDIRIKGFFLAKTVAILRKRDDEYYLVPGDGWIKPKLNYEPVKHETPIKELDVITIGSCQMQFRLKNIS